MPATMTMCRECREDPLLHAMEQARRALAESLAAPELRSASAALARAHVPERELSRLLLGVADTKGSQAPLVSLVSRVTAGGQPNDDARLERVMAMRQALDSLPRLSSLPVCSSVKLFWCEEVRAWTQLDGQASEACRVGTSRFAEMCTIATLQRFPGGQFDWMRSGLPLKYLLSVNWRALAQAFYVTAVRLRGRAPVFFTHLGCRRDGDSLSEVEANRSYHRMAASMMLQPDVKGMVASSWFRSPDTHRVSPRLAWVNTVVLEHGGFVAVRGRAEPDCGVFARSATRRRLYEAGTFVPTVGLVVWPRDAMLAWAHGHPEFA